MTKKPVARPEKVTVRTLREMKRKGEKIVALTANYTNNFGGGTADVIDQIRVRNESGGSGTVRILLAV
jgi:D-arabinose 5-phosphate isomerase GutQ